MTRQAKGRKNLGDSEDSKSNQTNRHRQEQTAYLDSSRVGSEDNYWPFITSPECKYNCKKSCKMPFWSKTWSRSASAEGSRWETLSTTALIRTPDSEGWRGCPCPKTRTFEAAAYPSEERDAEGPPTSSSSAVDESDSNRWMWEMVPLCILMAGERGGRSEALLVRSGSENKTGP